MHTANLTGRLVPLKRLLAGLLVSDLAYRSLVRRFIKNGFVSTSAGFIDVSNQAPQLQSLLFWGIYERSEVSMIGRFLPQKLPVIELGASLGYTTAAICGHVADGVQVIAVEANPRLLPNLESTRKKNGFDRLTLHSAAIDYSGREFVNFVPDEMNLGSRKAESETGVAVRTIRLSDMVLKNNLTEYSLVSDIEGAEIEMFAQERNPQTISGCKRIIIELHSAQYNGKQYLPPDVSALICQNFGMELIESDSKTWVFGKAYEPK